MLRIVGFGREAWGKRPSKAQGVHMSHSEIDAVRELLSSKPRPAGFAERRERLDAIGSTYPPDADVSLEATDANGVAAEWSLAPGSDASRVLLFFHGGGYCSGSIVSHRGMVTAVGRAAGVRTLAVAYRLAPEHPFPAAIEDARAAYGFLLDHGIAAPNIALGGDSAGGGLTLALMTSLRDAGKPLPGCAWLVSPWVDLRMSGASLAEKADVDPLISKPYLEELASAYLAGADAANPLVSPLNADLAGLPPLLVQVGSAETLLDDAVRIARRAGAADVRINLEIWPHMIHAWHLWAAQLEDGRRAIASASSRAVRPKSLTWLSGALAAIKARTISTCPRWAAAINAVSLWGPVTARALPPPSSAICSSSRSLFTAAMVMMS